MPAAPQIQSRSRSRNRSRSRSRSPSKQVHPKLKTCNNVSTISGTVLTDPKAVDNIRRIGFIQDGRDETFVYCIDYNDINTPAGLEYFLEKNPWTGKEWKNKRWIANQIMIFKGKYERDFL